MRTYEAISEVQHAFRSCSAVQRNAVTIMSRIRSVIRTVPSTADAATRSKENSNMGVIQAYSSSLEDRHRSLDLSDALRAESALAEEVPLI